MVSYILCLSSIQYKASSKWLLLWLCQTCWQNSWINDTVCFYNTTSFRHIKLIALKLTRSRTSENSGLLRVLRGRAGQRARISVVRGGKCLIKRYGSKVSQSSSTLEHWLTMLPCNISHGLSQLLERKGRTAGSHLIYY